MAVKRHWKLSTIASLIFLPLLLLFTGIINKFLFVPDWYPRKPTIFTPDNPLFTEYTLAWKLSDQWLFQLPLTDALWLFIFSFLFFLNVALVGEIYRNKLRVSLIHWLASPLAFVAFVGCCGSALMIFLLGAAVVFALTLYMIYFRILAVVLFCFNILLMTQKLSKLQKKI